MGSDVFIVHAAVDKAVASELAAALDSAGVTSFLDKRDQEPGAPWDEAIAKELRASLFQVVLLGDRDGWYQIEEVARAIANMRLIGESDRVIPVLLKERPDKVPYGLDRVQAVPWPGAKRLAAMLKVKVDDLRRTSNAAGAAAGRRRVSVAVVGVKDELEKTLDALASSVGTRTGILDGPVKVVDVAREDLPAVELTVVVLRACHAGKIDALAKLVERSRAEQPDVIVGAWMWNEGDIEQRHRKEADELSPVKAQVAIRDGYADVLIGHLAEAVDGWYAARRPYLPGRSAVREPWETDYLDEMSKLRRASSHVEAGGSRPVELAQWFIHLQAQPPWVEVAGEVRHEIRVRREYIDPTLVRTPELEAEQRPIERVGNRATPLSRRHRDLLLRAQQPDFGSRVVASPDTGEQALLHPDLWWGGQLDPERDRPDRSPAFRNWREPARPAWLDQVLSHPRLPRLLVVGPAGAGKTVLLEHLASVLESDEPAGDPAAPRHRVDRAGVRGSAPIAPIPVLHRATTLVAHLRDSGGGPRPIRDALADLLVSKDTFRERADHAVILAGIKAGRYVFLIDGLDEVPAADDRRALVAALGCLEGAHTRVILTTRPGSHTGVDRPAGFVMVEVAPFDRDAATRLVTAWVRTWMPDANLDHVLSEIDKVRSDVPARGDDRSPVENPLLLASMLRIYKDRRHLPKHVATLYQEMIGHLCLRRRRRDESDEEREARAERYRVALRDLFLAAQDRGGAGLSLADARDVVVTRKHASSSGATAWLVQLANDTNLIRIENTESGEVVRPWHRSYQEYLAAEALVVKHADTAAAGVKYLRAARAAEPSSRLMDPVWRDTLGFLVGAAIQVRTWGASLMEALVAAAMEGGPDQARLYRLVAEGLDEYRGDFEKHRVFKTLPDQLVKDFEAHGEAWPLDDRLRALDALGRLGDPRLDPGKRDPWVTIEAGEARVSYRVGADHVDAFQMMWRPVTVQDYRPFVEDPSYDSWFVPERVPYTAHYVNPAPYGPPAWWEEQIRHPNRPVVGVSWHEAAAYARWLDARTGGGVSLPIELQWVRAALGTDAGPFPWGDADPGSGDLARANYSSPDGLVVGHPSPVGAFPRGHLGRMVDLAGNVAEWCAELHEDDSAVVCRGGSWNDLARDLDSRLARTAIQTNYRGPHVGFRLARRHQRPAR